MRIVLLGLVSLILWSCAGSPLQTAAVAEEHRAAMIDIRMGMNKWQVRKIMGLADKTEMRSADGDSYTVWFYITKGAFLTQLKLIPENYTPFIFDSSNDLVGWGNHHYRYLFNPDYRARYDKRVQEEIQQEVSSDEWIPGAGLEHLFQQTPASGQSAPLQESLPSSAPQEEVAPINNTENLEEQQIAPQPEPALPTNESGQDANPTLQKSTDQPEQEKSPSNDVQVLP
jgi:hypothetical protein